MTNIGQFNVLEPEDFCQKWVPKLSNLQPEDWGFQTASCKLLSYLTGYTIGSVRNWFLKPTSPSYRKPDIIVLRYLKLLDTLWEVELVLGSLSNQSNSFQQVSDYLRNLS